MPHVSFPHRSTPVLPLLGALACGAGEPASTAPSAERTDSAGVEIVLHRAPWDAIPTFATVDPVPELRLGSLAGAAAEQFASVSDVRPLPGGGVAVLDRQAAELRLFSADGSWRATLGAKGEGPGEFQSPVRLEVLSGDTLAVFDPQPRRITRFAPDGTLGRITTLAEMRARVSDGAFLPDGRFVGQSRLVSEGATPPSPGASLVRDTTVLTLFDVEGTPVNTLDVLPGLETVVHLEIATNRVSIWRRPTMFARANHLAVAGRSAWTSESDRFELRLRDIESGALRRVVRAPQLQVPVTETIARDLFARAVEDAENAEMRKQTEDWQALSPRPELAPAFDAFVADEQGRLWVRSWSADGSGGRWWVFREDGFLLGSVDVPTGLTITHVTCDAVWGVQQDELEVDHVVRYRLRGAGC